MHMLEEYYDASMVSRDKESICIKVNGNLEKYRIVKLYEFDSDRRMMSITVQREADGELINYAKGADTAISQRLAHIGFDEK